MNKLIAAIALIVILGGGWLVLRGGGQETAEEAQEFKAVPAEVSGKFIRGQEAPDVTFTDFEGNTYQLSQFAGKAVVLDFWAGWCPFCIEEMPELQEAQDRYEGELWVVGVHRTDTEAAATGLKFAKERGVSYLLVADSNGSLYQAVGGFGMPVAVFIDKKGVVQEIKSGPKTAEEIESKIAALLQK